MILVHPRFWGVFLLAVLLLPAAAYSQDATTQERLDRIERDLNMLQRQVYRGAPTPPPGAGSGGTTGADVEIRMERLEEQMRDLTGKVEQIANGLDQLRQRIEQINSDYDVRFNQLSGGTSLPPARTGSSDSSRFAAAPSAPPFPPPPPGSTGPAPGSIVPPPSSASGPSPIFNTLTPPGSGSSRQPPPPPPAPDAAGADAAAPAGTAAQQFNHAFGLLKQADYPAAEAALRAFIEAHPSDPLAANAQYWLGETLYARNKFMEAAAAFAEGYKRYPHGAKAADDLLKMGMSLARADQKRNACVAFAQLDEMPGASAAIRERANAEKKRAGCT
jgi:tol-pal system protein YbgF